MCVDTRSCHWSILLVIRFNKFVSIALMSIYCKLIRVYISYLVLYDSVSWSYKFDTFFYFDDSQNHLCFKHLGLFIFIAEWNIRFGLLTSESSCLKITNVLIRVCSYMCYALCVVMWPHERLITFKALLNYIREQYIFLFFIFLNWVHIVSVSKTKEWYLP